MSDVERLAAEIRACLDGDDWTEGVPWVDQLAAYLIAAGVRWARPVEDVELPEVNE